MTPQYIIAAQDFEGELYIKASDHHRAVRAAVMAEREACAKACEEQMLPTLVQDNLDIRLCAAVIRARSQA